MGFGVFGSGVSGLVKLALWFFWLCVFSMFLALSGVDSGIVLLVSSGVVGATCFWVLAVSS